MDTIKIEQNILFSSICPYLKKTVFLDKETWYIKITPVHPEVSNCIELVKQILFKDKKEDILIYRKRRDSTKVAIFKKCPHLTPNYLYIKIGLRLTTDGKYIVRTVHGQNNPPTSDVEEIK